MDPASAAGDAYGEFWRTWLTGSEPLVGGSRSTPTLAVADLFSGCGGLSVGVREACRSLGIRERIVLAVDTSPNALAVFGDNFAPDRIHQGDVQDLVDGELGAPLTRVEKRLRGDLEGLGLAVGGPPCQGHSDLNNHTRRRDPKNALYLRMARFVEVVRPASVIIENVPGVIHDRSGVVGRACASLQEAGYHISHGVLAADSLGWVQKRKRHVLIASLVHDDLTVEGLADSFLRPARPVSWALQGCHIGDRLMDTPANHAEVNRRRIEYLFEHDLYELPDHQRPDCHRLKPHSYKSVYGRMRPDEPAPTITSGFGSTGQGRFVHPFEPRTLTPREAARVQGFPDWFSFDAVQSRTILQELIGNAVPSRLGYVAAVGLLR